MTKINIRGFSRVNTDGVSSLLDKSEIRELENMRWGSSDSVVIRDGSTLYKSNAQYGSSVHVVTARDIDFGDGTGPYEFFALSDGKLAYNNISTYVNSATSFTTLTGLSTSSSAQRALAILNRRLYITDESGTSYYVDSSKTLKVNQDPLGFYFTLTVDAAVAATVDAVYSDDDAPTQTYIVTETKATTVGITLKIRQLTGDARPVTTGASALTKVSGTGDSAIAFTAITYPEKYISCGVHEGRLALISDAGTVYLSEVNNGLDLDGAGTGDFTYGLEDSLTVTNIVPFKRSSLISLENTSLSKYGLASITGYLIPTGTSDTREGVIRIRKESKTLGFVGRSAQEVGNSGIGLTRASGFISFSSLDVNADFGLTDNESISDTIKAIVDNIDWTQSDNIASTVDSKNQLYMCAVPLTTSTRLNYVLVFDYKRSVAATRDRAAINKWSIFSYNIGESDIKSLFSLRDKVFIGTSDGRIVEINVPDTYTDVDGAYVSHFRSKAVDADDKSSLKEFTRAYAHLLIGEDSIPLKILPIIDGEVIYRNYLGASLADVTVNPREIGISYWTDSESDVWTNSYYDVWESQYATEITVDVTEGLYQGQEAALMIENVEGGKFWGITGITFEYLGDVADQSDHRPNN